MRNLKLKKMSVILWLGMGLLLCLVFIGFGDFNVIVLWGFFYSSQCSLNFSPLSSSFPFSIFCMGPSIKDVRKILPIFDPLPPLSYINLTKYVRPPLPPPTCGRPLRMTPIQSTSRQSPKRPQKMEPKKSHNFLA